jgi:ATP-binding cassette subfamily F protein 3
MLFRLTNVTRSYGGLEVLRGLSLQANPGEKIGLVGRNGAGKTTVFRLITGEESPDSGDVVRSGGLKIGLLSQHVEFAPGETVHSAALGSVPIIHDLEREMRDLERVMETDHSAAVLDRYADLQTAFETAGGFTYTARAEAILTGIGFRSERWNDDAARLSGGERNRLGMACLLLSDSDILLLDEPTNHLDVSAVEWLETFLAEQKIAYVVISHDRYFLDRTCTRIVEIENGRAASYPGNYSKFVVARELRREQQIREYENQQAMIAKTKEFIRKNLEGQKTKQAKSRRNMLERLDRIDPIASERSGGRFGLKEVERTGNNVLTVEDVSLGYPSRKLVSNVSFAIHRGDVLGVIGGNGTGKTTLLRTLLGQIAPLSGSIAWGTKVDIGYYAQNLEGLEPRNDVIGELRRVAPLVESGTLRLFLARFLFEGDDVFKSVSDLSGGEKGRLALAKLIYSRKNVLILDEPTNHLDIPAREALEAALTEYTGTIIAVSHDRFFLDRISNHTLAFEEGGVVEFYAGNYTEYHDWRLRSARPAPLLPEEGWPKAGVVGAAGGLPHASGTAGSASPPSAIAGGSPGSEPPAVAGGLLQASGTNASDSPPAAIARGSKLSKNQLTQIKKRIAAIEAEIPLLEQELARLSAEIASPEVAADYEKLQTITSKFQEKETQIQDLYDEWETLASELK